ncbi:hypothetical protein B0H14DRAFT_2645573 [Mycena olivaceomarginata]|nr:hypothetical protein B0H14DRAFT_2645573 [Mycena olivaceomarginata]
MSSHPVCGIPFEPNPENYKNDNEHDANPRKHWYLILGVGLFTKKWKRHCMRRHTEDDHSNPRHCSDPDDGEDDGDDAPPRAHSAAPSVLRSTRSIGRAASAAARFDASPGNTADTDHTDDDMPPLLYGVEGDPEGINVGMPRARSAALAVPRGTRFSAHSASAVLPVKRERPSSLKREPPPSPVKREHRSLVKRETPASPVTKIPLYCDMSDSELTDREVDQGDVFMAPASPVPMPPTISPTASTVSSLSSDSSDLGVSSSVRPAAPQMGAAGPSSRSMGLGESISGARHAPRKTGAALPPASVPPAQDPMQVFAEVKPGESLQVVGQEEVVEYCAGQSARGPKRALSNPYLICARNPCTILAIVARVVFGPTGTWSGAQTGRNLGLCIKKLGLFLGALHGFPGLSGLVLWLLATQMTRLGLEIDELWTSTPKTKTGKTRTMCSSQGSGRLRTAVAIAPAARFRSGNIDSSSVGQNSRVTAEKKRAVTGNRAKALAADIELWEADREEHANALAEKHGLKVKEVRRRMLSSTTFKPPPQG